ncbi:MAG: ribonuclease H-like domain-containing protein [Pseudomonadota bacterium]|nr:ribonuclease H-like domain-containing protein [Pseudomonadota bacterium]
MKTFKFGESKIFLHHDDLPTGIKYPDKIAIDTETTGLSLVRDRLCLIQFAFSKKECHLVKFKKDISEKENNSPEIVKLLENDEIEKIFHYARFDAAMIKKFLKVELKNIFCTKIASKLSRTYTDKHGLKELCKEFLNVDLSKAQQSSDWSADQLSDSQIKYASNDVIYLFELKYILEDMLKKEGRQSLAKKIFEFLPTRIKLDFLDWNDVDIFSH